MSSSRPLQILNAGVLALALVATSCSSSGSGDHADSHASVPAHTASLRRTHAQAVGGPHHVDTELHHRRRSRLARHRMDYNTTAAEPDRHGGRDQASLRDVAGTQLTALLRQYHILTAADLITAAKANGTDKSRRRRTSGTRNADSIADFLARANPDNWPAAQMRSDDHDHLDQSRSPKRLTT